ncbi:MAG: hypothetical protein IJW22_00125 [Clostridia bacterium]|nr:hypothetical protein [Clostridia bacterium]
MDRRKKSTRYLAASAMLCALGVILLALGSLVQVLDISMAVIASLFVILAVIELGGKYPYLIYAVTALLAMLLVPYKSAPLYYLCFMGYYPIIKAKIEGKLTSRVLEWVIKLAVFCAALAVAVLVAVKVLALFEIPPLYYALLLLCIPVFVLYDIALTRLVSAYYAKWRHLFRFLHK